MSISNRMYDRLCKLYRLMLVRMRNMEAANALPMLAIRPMRPLLPTTSRVAPSPRQRWFSQVANAAASMAGDSNPQAVHALESLEPRVLLSGSAPALAGMHLTDSDTANWQGQIVYLDFDGQENLTYGGSVNVDPFDMPAYQAPHAQAGQEEAIKTQVLQEVQSIFAGTGVQLTLVRPDEGSVYSTVHIGGDDNAFHAYGRFDGLADGVDVGNQNPSDNALVFTAGLSTTAQLVEVITHETAHLLGYAHEDDGGQNVLASVADNTFTISQDASYVNQNDRFLTFMIIRSDISTTQTIYVSTLQDQGDLNEGNYIELDHLAITFDQGKNTAQVTVAINDLGLTSGSKTFRLIVQDSLVDPLSPELATTEFTIVNNATGTFGTSYILGLDTEDTGIVDYLPQLYDTRYRFIGLHLGLDSDHLTAADAAQIQAAGMKVFSIFEQEGMSDTDTNGDHTYAWQTYYTEAQGEADAAAAYIAATQHALQPFDSAIYFSIDLNPADTSGITQQEALDNISLYFQGIQTYFSTLPAESSYTIGVMGAGDTLTQVTNDGLAQYTWLASPGAWPGYSDWNPSSNYPAASNVIQQSAIGPQSRYGNIEFNRDSNWSLPLGSWHEVITPQLSVNTAELALTNVRSDSVGKTSILRVKSLYLSQEDMVTVTVPAGFEVSSGGSGDYSESVTLTPVNGYLYQSIYVRINTETLGDITGDLTITSNLDSSLSKTVHLTGEVRATDDTTAPTVDAFDVSPNLATPGSPINIAYTVSDTGGAGLSSVNLYRAADVDGAPGSYTFLSGMYLSQTPLPIDSVYSDVYTDTPDTGKWWYRILVQDTNGNLNIDGAGAAAPIAVTVQDMTPTVTGISPASGSTLGGTEVVITGTFFTDASAVFFGDQEATSFTVDSDTQITAIAPANAVAGVVHVTVTTPEGTTSSVAASQFTYQVYAANLTPVEPAGWSSKLVMSHQLGTHSDDAQIYNDQDVYVDFAVTNTGQLATGAFGIDLYLDGNFWKTLQAVSSVAGGETIAFEDVNVGLMPAGSHALQIRVDAGGVIIESNEADNNYSRNIIVLRGPDTVVPSVDAFSVSQTTITPGTPLKIDYTVSDTGGAGVKFIEVYKLPDVNGEPGARYFMNMLGNATDGPFSSHFFDTQTTTPGTGKWWYSIKVIDADGNASLGSDFGFDPIAVTVQNISTITDISPAQGLIAGGQAVVITGTDFSNATAVHFGDIEASNFIVDSDTQITVIVPVVEHAGVVDVTVTTLVGTSPVTGNTQFTYLLPPANLAVDQPTGWSDAMVVSKTTGSHTDDSPLLDSDNLYLDWSITNDGQTDTAGSFITSLYVDSILKKQWQTDSAVVVNGTFVLEDYEMGQLAAGTHTLELVIDSNNDIAEINETDNTYSRTITVEPAPNLPPGVLLQTPATIVSDDVTIRYTLSDPESDATSILAEYSSDSGATWHAATAGQGGDGTSGLSSSATGIAHTFVWDSQADMPNTQSTQVRFRLTPSDSSNQGAIASTDDFVVNHLPQVSDLASTLDQDTTLRFDEAYFAAGYHDTDTNQTMTYVRFTSLPEHGTIRYDGTPIALRAVIASGTLSNLTYTPDAGYTGQDSFSWSAKDGIFFALAATQVNLTINPNIAPEPIDITFDFGTATSPLLAGATRVTETTAYSAGQGYGWQSGVIDSRDRGPVSGSNAQTRDLNFTTEGVFAVDLANGSYAVTVQLGDMEYAHDQMGVALESGGYDSITNAAKQIITKTYNITITDGQLNLRLKDLGGIDGNVCIESLRIVSNINHPPVVNDIALTSGQDTLLSLNSLNFSAVFYDQDAGNMLQQIIILTLPEHGTLELDGQAVETNQQILVNQLGSLSYTPDNGYIGQDSFSWNGSDGLLYAVASADVLLTMEANHAPVVTDINKLVTLDTPIAFSGSDFTSRFFDQDSGNALQTVSILTLPEHGTLELDGNAVVANQQIFVNQLGTLTYTPDAGYVGDDSFGWNGSDGQLYGDVSASVLLTIQEQAEKLFDFSTASSPLEAGYKRVTELTTYSAGLGYGWQSGVVQSRDRGVTATSNAVTQDLHFTANAVFAVDLANGSYNVTIQLGDKGEYAHDQMGVFMENTQFGSVNSAAGQVVSNTYNVTVTDGQLSLRLQDLGGIDANVCIVGLQIVSGLPVNHPPVQTDINKTIDQDNTTTFTSADFTSAFSDPDPGDLLVHVTITDLPQNGTLLLDGVAVTAGQQIAANQLSTLTYTPDSGHWGSDSFGWLGSNGTQEPVSATRVNLTINRLPAFDFDFGTAGSPLLAGTTRVTDTTTYNAGLGYGWQSGVLGSRDRGALAGTNAQTRDLIFTNDAVFAVDVENGSYDVIVQMGDAQYAHEQMGVILENVQYDSITNAIGQVVSRTYTVTVTDGQLNLRLKDLGGIDPNVCIEGLQIFRNV